jgi:hypothetical protein
MGTSRVKGRPKSFIEKGSRKRRRPNAQPLVTNATINISTSLPGDQVQEAHVIILLKIIYWINFFFFTFIYHFKFCTPLINHFKPLYCQVQYFSN